MRFHMNTRSTVTEMGRTLTKVLDKKRVWVRPGMRPFQVHINEETILTLSRIYSSPLTSEILNSVMKELRYRGVNCELTWARPFDKSYGKVRLITHSKGLLLTIFV